jgi:hypothetical protein
LKSLNLSAERSLHTGEVVGSIPTAPTKNALHTRGLLDRPLPVPPALKHEQKVFPPLTLGENWGILFDTCSRQCTELIVKENPGDGVGCPTPVISLEGVRELQSLNAHSDKTDLERRFDHKQLISPVRTHITVAQYPPRPGTVVPSLAPDLRQSS